MPLYEYRCEACGHVFERIQKFSDPPVEVCPNCGEQRVRKLLSSPAIQFKGSGWYITDYARKGGGDAPAKSGDASAKSGSAESKNAESKGGESKSGESKSRSSESTGTSSSSGSTSGTPASKE